MHYARMYGQINFWKEINTCIKQECIKLIDHIDQYSKDINKVTTCFYFK